MRSAVIIMALLVSTPSWAFFNSFPGGYLTGICLGLNPMCWIGKNIHDSQPKQEQQKQEEKKDERVLDKKR